jgi:hypothetical protein
MVFGNARAVAALWQRFVMQVGLGFRLLRLQVAPAAQYLQVCWGLGGCLCVAVAVAVKARRCQEACGYTC